jgi:hypothetical protein
MLFDGSYLGRSISIELFIIEPATFGTGNEDGKKKIVFGVPDR